MIHAAADKEVESDLPIDGKCPFFGKRNGEFKGGGNDGTVSTSGALSNFGRGNRAMCPAAFRRNEDFSFSIVYREFSGEKEFRERK